MVKKMLAAALLPLPFAAIPLFAVVFAGTTQPENNNLAFESAPIFEVAPDLNVISVNPAEQAVPLAYTGGDHEAGCIDVEGGI